MFAAALLSSAAYSASPGAAPEAVQIELNRLEDQGTSCRAYLVIVNPSAVSYNGFKLDLVVFDRSGTIIRRLALDLAPLRAEKTSAKVFDILDTSCAAIGNVLLNEVLDCRDISGVIPDCVERVSTSSKLAVSLSK